MFALALAAQAGISGQHHEAWPADNRAVPRGEGRKGSERVTVGELLPWSVSPASICFTGSQEQQG